MNNVLIRLIDRGKIRTLEELKSAYRTLLMKTHPDAAGSDVYLEDYLLLGNHYREASSFLAGRARTGDGGPPTPCANYRLAFFQHLHIVESLEVPYAFHPEEYTEKVVLARKAALEAMTNWNRDWVELYERADGEYARIKAEKPMGPYLKHALALNIRPLVHNLVAYHLTGRDVYLKQARQNLSGIMHRLRESECEALREFLSILLEDMKKGPAVLE